MSAIQAIGSWANQMIFLPPLPMAQPRVVAGPHDFVLVPAAPAGYASEECAICAVPLFGRLISPEHPEIHQSVVAHRPRGMGINALITHHIHLECLEQAMMRKAECPTCRTAVSLVALQALPRNRLPAPRLARPLVQRAVQWIVEYTRTLGKKVIDSTLLSATVTTISFFTNGFLVEVVMLLSRVSSDLAVSHLREVSFISLVAAPFSAALTTLFIHTILDAGSALISKARFRWPVEGLAHVLMAGVVVLVAYQVLVVVPPIFAAHWLGLFFPSSQVLQAINLMQWPGPMDILRVLSQGSQLGIAPAVISAAIRTRAMVIGIMLGHLGGTLAAFARHYKIVDDRTFY